MDRWLHAQRLGVTASVLLTHSGTHPAFRAARKILQTDLTDTRAAPRGFDFFRTLPPWVLAVLARAFKQSVVPRLSIFAILADKALQHNLIGREDDTSTVARAQIWAYHALLSHTRDDGLLRLGRTLFGHHQQWLTIDSNPQSRKEISRCLATVRDPLRSTREKCDAIGRLGEILRRTPFWEQIENILYHNQFCWPLLVFDSAPSPRDRQALALSLPVAVDIRFDNRAEICQASGAGVLVPRWEEQLKKAVNAAKALWQSQHVNCGSFRDMVEVASVTLDFSFAEKIVADLAHALNARVSLTDRSAEAYFAEVVLARLMGSDNVMVSAVTGVIGDQAENRDEDGWPSFPFGAPQGMAEKIQYVAATGFLERIVLPEAHESRDAAAHSLDRFDLWDHEKTGKLPVAAHRLEILYAKDLESVSDHVLPVGWRQPRYIRCPELEWAIHSPTGPGPMEPSADKRVREVVARLSSNTSPLIKLDASPIVVASALCYIDHRLRHEELESSRALSWAFVNVTEGKASVRWDDEKDIFFWELFFKAMGLGAREFRGFLRRPNRKEAVKSLTAYLNRFVPTPDQPHRCPDVIILIGRQTLTNSMSRSRTASVRPFMVIPVMEELKDSLRPTGKPHDAVTGFIGKTRIVVLPDKTLDEPTADLVFLNDLGGEELRQLRYLATLEERFTSRTAGLLLFRSEAACGQVAVQELLDRFFRQGFIRCVHGKYHVPSVVAKKIPTDETSEDKVRRYYAAGAALAPYVVGGQGALSMAVDVTFTSEYCQEANQHFRQALHHSRKAGSAEVGQLRESIEEAVRRLARFIMPPSWANVSRLLKGANRLPGVAALEPYEKACELLRWYEEAEIPPHPFHLVTAASSAVRAASCVSLYVENPRFTPAIRTRCEESPLQLHAKAKGFYLEALQGCSLLPKNERETTRLFCLTRYLAYLCQRHWVLIEHEKPADRERKEAEIQRLWSEIVDLMNRRVKLYIADGLECFERMGDREPDHNKALDRYSRGLRTGLIWSPLSLKAWGAASLSGQTDLLSSMLKNFPAQEKGHLVYKAFHNAALAEAKLSLHELLRTKEGLRVFERFHGNTPSVKVTKGAFDRDYGRDSVRGLVEDTRPYSRGVVTGLKHDEHYAFLCSPDGKRYRFQAFQLVEGLAYEDLSEGMELDFRVLREDADGRIGDAVNVRRPLRPGESPIQTGTVSSLRSDGAYGFISSGGREYHFHASRLQQGLAYDDLYEGMWVEFQMSRGRPGGRTDEATNIAPIKDHESDLPDSSAATGVRGTISELKHHGDYGFIVSCGKEYHFHASHLAQGLSYEDVHEGMEVEFDIVREATAIRCGQARRITEIGGGCHGGVEHGGLRDCNIGDRAGATSLNSHHMPEDLTRLGKVSLYKQEGRFGFLSADGTEYYFNESDLLGGLTSTRIYEGMEVEFTVSHEQTERASPRATNVRLIGLMTDWLLSVKATFITGRISFVKTNSPYGFIRTPCGQDYYFSGSDLRAGLIFSCLQEGMEVEFQVRSAGQGNKAPAAMNVRSVPNNRKSTHPAPAGEPDGSASSRGSISFIKRDGDYGFIRSLNGSDYYFHESDLADETNYQDLHNGMAVEFQILREGRPGRTGQAISVCAANESAQEALPDQRGVVYCLVPEMRCGFMSTEDGEEYQFTESDLIGGLKYEDVREGTRLTFIVRKKPGKKAGKAMNVALIEE